MAKEVLKFGAADNESYFMVTLGELEKNQGEKNITKKLNKCFI